jgi:N-acetylmuramoyl-L-alanine amidase
MLFDQRRSFKLATAFIGVTMMLQGVNGAALAEERLSEAAHCVPRQFKVVIDVGHTIDARGATSARGVSEYNFNLNLANHLSESLKDAGFDVSLVIVRGTGTVQLVERSVRANALKPDLLISIHHDDVQSQYHAAWTYRGSVQSYSDRYSGYSLFVSYLNGYLDRSLQFSKLAATQLRLHGMHPSLHHAENIPGEHRELLNPDLGIYRYDGLVVLKSSDAPAVLLEAGIITNREEELVLASPERQSLVAAALTAATAQFCAKR